MEQKDKKEAAGFTRGFFISRKSRNTLRNESRHVEDVQ